MDLFKGKSPESESSTTEPAEDYQQDLADARLMEEQRARIEDLVAFNSDIIRPTRLGGSKYHALLTKDFKVSNFQDKVSKDERFAAQWVSLINHALYMGFESFAVILHSELVAFLAVKGSIDGFERKLLVSQILTKHLGKSTDEITKSGFRL